MEYRKYSSQCLVKNKMSKTWLSLPCTVIHLNTWSSFCLEWVAVNRYVKEYYARKHYAYGAEVMARQPSSRQPQKVHQIGKWWDRMSRERCVLQTCWTENNFQPTQKIYTKNMEAQLAQRRKICGAFFFEFSRRCNVKLKPLWLHETRSAYGSLAWAGVCGVGIRITLHIKRRS